MVNKLLVYFISVLVATFALTVIAARILIPILKSKKMGQRILDVGPRWHKNKEGTPTMGGIAFISAMLVVLILCAIFTPYVNTHMLLVFGFALLNGMIGVFDDYVKLCKKQNEGLSAAQKYLLQLIAAGAFLFGRYLCGIGSTAVYIPFLGVELELMWFYYPLALILLTGIVNSVNLTDGLDGLASSITFFVACFFAIASFVASNVQATLLSAMLIGGTLGFLVYNFYPARVFMGDTGSLFLGGMVVGLAFMLDNPLIIIIAGFIYIAETLSVIIQVTYFKLTHGKRLFKMSPIHHHFEKCGWSEIKIVAVFSAITAALCAAAYFGLAG